MTAATAYQLIDAVYDALDAADTAVDDYNTAQDGVHYIDLNGHTLRIFDDIETDIPNGISWWIDTPHELGCVSDGWEILPEENVDAEAKKIAEQFLRRAAVEEEGP